MHKTNLLVKQFIMPSHEFFIAKPAVSLPVLSKFCLLQRFSDFRPQMILVEYPHTHGGVLIAEEKTPKKFFACFEQLPFFFSHFFPRGKNSLQLFFEGDILCPDEFANARATLDSHTISAGESGRIGARQKTKHGKNLLTHCKVIIYQISSYICSLKGKTSNEIAESSLPGKDHQDHQDHQNVGEFQSCELLQQKGIYFSGTWRTISKANRLSPKNK